MTLTQAKYLTLDDLLIETAFHELFLRHARDMTVEDAARHRLEIAFEVREELNERYQQKTI